jgi:hypothetical protein
LALVPTTSDTTQIKEYAVAVSDAAQLLCPQCGQTWPAALQACACAHPVSRCCGVPLAVEYESAPAPQLGPSIRSLAYDLVTLGTLGIVGMLGVQALLHLAAGLPH